MTHYQVYLETDNDGRCMAHVLELPGCTARASTQEDAVKSVPAAVHTYNDWLRKHGEAIPPEADLVEVEIAEQSLGFGPFDPGDAAALFLPDKRPFSQQEMEALIIRLSFSRVDLSELIAGLPAEVLDRQPAPHTFSIRRILRHLGNAEEWYISRIVPPERLPPEWEHDEDLPILEFLEMERRTVIACMRLWTEEERSGVHYQPNFTRNPEEPWTARKVLRRLLEHELEHTGQIKEVLGGV